MNTLRRVKVKAKHSGNETKGFFHDWFTKVYESGESLLVAIVEQEENGLIRLFRMDEFDIMFEKEVDPLDNFQLLPSAGK